MLKNLLRKEPSASEISDVGLPQKTTSLCPECLTAIPAVIDEEQDRVWMRKTCPEHGDFKELISTDVRFYIRQDQWEWPRKKKTGSPIQSPLKLSEDNCPRDCGLCSQHRSSTMMTVMDITNRCNLRCPVCFANSAATGKVCEMSLEQIEALVQKSLTVGQAGSPCFQFSGGEPTLHPQFLEAIRIVKRAGFAQIQTASNGVEFARKPDLAAEASEAGLNVIYLQFDGVDDDVYRKTRGRELWEIKNKAVENIRRAGMEIMLVPTLIKGVNDHQVGKIFQFAVDHSDTVIGISWQPVAFTGRVPYEQRVAMRFTMADLARELEKQTGGAIQMYRDWYPLSFVTPFSRLLEAITGQAHPAVSCHRHCGMGNYILVDPTTKSCRSITSFVDVEGLMAKMDKLADLLDGRRWFKQLTLMRALKDMEQYFQADRAPEGWGTKEFIDFMSSFAEFRNRYPDNEARMRAIAKRRYRYLLMVGMHFQDVYNYELPRVQQCVIHYIASDGKMYPFCTYNGGPCHRDRVEQNHSRADAEPGIACCGA